MEFLVTMFAILGLAFGITLIALSYSGVIR